MAAEYFCTTCDRSFQSLDDLTLVRDWYHGRAVYRDSAGLIHSLKRKKQPAPVVAPVPQVEPEEFTDMLSEIVAETEIRPELPVERLEEESEPEEPMDLAPWK